MKHKHFNRLLSMLLVVATLFGILAVPASAALSTIPVARTAGHLHTHSHI